MNLKYASINESKIPIVYHQWLNIYSKEIFLHANRVLPAFISGGFDNRLRENVEYLEELKKLAEREGVSQRVRFITSCSTAERNALLGQCLCVLYTPKVCHDSTISSMRKRNIYS